MRVTYLAMVAVSHLMYDLIQATKPGSILPIQSRALTPHIDTGPRRSPSLRSMRIVSEEPRVDYACDVRGEQGRTIDHQGQRVALAITFKVPLLLRLTRRWSRLNLPSRE